MENPRPMNWLYFESPWPGGASRYVQETARILNSAQLLGGVSISYGALGENDLVELRSFTVTQQFKPFLGYETLHKSGRVRRRMRQLLHVVSIPVIIPRALILVLRHRSERLVVFAGGYPSSPGTMCVALFAQIFARGCLLFVLSMPRPVSGRFPFLGKAVDGLVKRTGVKVVVNSLTQKAAFHSTRSLESRSILVCRNPLASGGYIAPGQRHSNQPLQVVYYGRLDPLKDVESLLKSVPILSQRGVELAVTIIGDGPERKRLEQVVEELGIQDQVEFRGYLPNVSLEVLNNFHVGVIPSLWEGMPYALLDLIAAGACMVCTRVGGIGEVIEDSKTGLLVDPKRPDQIADALTDLFRNENKRVQLARRSQQAISKFASQDEWESNFRSLWN